VGEGFIFSSIQDRRYASRPMPMQRGPDAFG
jgi:hypothetical protein